MAETQPFVLQTRACRGHIREATHTSGLESADDERSKQSCREESFQLGLCERSHIQDPAAAADMESTQAFVSVEATQLYTATSSKNASDLDAAQADGDQEEEPATGSVVPEREGWEHLALEATQAYLPDPCHESEEETDDEEKRSVTAEETQPFSGPASATLAMAETQPMCAFEEEDIKHPVPAAVQERAEHSGAQGRLLKLDLSLAETQPMCTSDDRESDDEDSFPGLRKRKTKQLQIEEEQTQPLTSSEQSTVDTQPLQTAAQDLAPGGSRAFHQHCPVLQFKKEKPAALISSDLSTAETQLMTTGDDEESDEADAVLALPRRKAEPLQHQEDETRAAVGEPSGFQRQPMISGDNDDGVNSLPGPEKVKPSQILEERIQLLTNSTSSTQETGVLETTAEAGTSGSKVDGRRGTRANSRQVSTQYDEPSRRPTRGIKDCSAAARRGTSKSGKEKDEELEDKEEQRTNEAEGIQPRNDVEVLNKTEQNISQTQKQEEPSLGEQRGDPELGQHENMEKERKETEEGEENKRIQKDTEQLEREKKDLEDKERLERDEAEREEKRLEKEKNVVMANEQTEQEAKEMLESERRKHENLGREDQQPSARRDRIEGSEKEQLTEEKTVKKQEQKQENKAQVSARGRRASQRAALSKAEPAADTCVSTNDDVPARRTRSRSNSSNSVSSERSALSVNVQESRGRGARRSSDPPRVLPSRSSSRRKTVAAHPTQGGSNDDTGIAGELWSSNSSNLSFKQSPQGQGRGGRQRTRGGKAEAVSPAVSQSNPKTGTRGRKNTKAQSSSPAEKAGSQQATTSRGQRRSSSNGSGPTEAKGSSNQGELVCNEESLQSKRNVRGRSHKLAKREAVVAPQPPAVSSPGETKELRKGRKRGSEANTDIDSDRSSKCIKGGEIEQTPGEAEEAPKRAQDEIPAHATRRSRASVAQTKKPLNPSGPGLKETNERIVEEPVEKRGRGRLAEAQKQTREGQEDAEESEEQRARVLQPEVTRLLPSHTHTADVISVLVQKSFHRARGPGAFLSMSQPFQTP